MLEGLWRLKNVIANISRLECSAGTKIDAFWRPLGGKSRQRKYEKNLGNFDEVCLPFKRFQNSLYMLRGLIIICLFTVLVVMVMRDLPAGAPVKLRRVITAFSVP